MHVICCQKGPRVQIAPNYFVISLHSYVYLVKDCIDDSDNIPQRAGFGESVSDELSLRLPRFIHVLLSIRV